MSTLFGILPLFPTIVVSAALLIAAILGVLVTRSLERGAYQGAYLGPLVIGDVVLVVLTQFYECAAGGKCLLGFPSESVFVGGMAAVGVIASIAAIIVLPISALILASHAFGWLYWLLRGKRSFGAAALPAGPAASDQLNEKSKVAPKRFGKRAPD